MIPYPLLALSFLRPAFLTPVAGTRSLRPTIKIGKDRFQLSVDVRQFNKDELKVKAHPEYVIIEGKQEKKTAQGYTLRHFVRKFKLPEGCVPSKIQSRLSSDGVLTIVAPRAQSDSSLPTEPVSVPITFGKNVGKPTVSVSSTKTGERVGPGSIACRSRPKIQPRQK